MSEKRPINWDYGNAWDKYPIQSGEVWNAGDNKVACGDLYNPQTLQGLMQGQQVDMLYVDPPWNLGNIKSFYTKAQIEYDQQPFFDFLKIMLEQTKQVVRKSFYIEMGNQYIEHLEQMAKEAGIIHVKTYKITYYRTKPTNLFYGVTDQSYAIEGDCTGMDDLNTPDWAMAKDNPTSVLDVCGGLGLTARTAHKRGIQSFILELNKKRIANLLKYYDENGLPPSK